MSQDSNKSSRIFKIVLIVLVLFGMPMLGIYFLNKGTTTYMDSKAEMIFYKDSISLKQFKTKTIEDELLSSDMLRGNMAVMHFYDANCQNCDSVLAVLNKMKGQFKELEVRKLYFITFVMNADSMDIENEIIRKKALHQKKWKFVNLADEGLKNQLLDNLKLKEGNALQKVALLDTSSYLVNHYDFSKGDQKEEANKFYKHFSMLTPDKEKRKSINN